MHHTRNFLFIWTALACSFISPVAGKHRNGTSELRSPYQINIIGGYDSDNLDELVKKTLIVILATVTALLVLPRFAFSKISEGGYVNAQVYNYLTISIIVAVLCWIINKKYWQKKELCKIASYKNILTIFILMAMISFTLITPSIKNANLYFSLNQSPSSQDFFLGNFKGDKEVINFIKTQLPVKSVLLTDSESLGTFSVMLDQYMAYNLGSAWDGNLNRIFQPNIPDWQKDELITSPKYAVDYIFVRDPKIQDKKYFENNPNLFKKIYDKDSQIYEVIK